MCILYSRTLYIRIKTNLSQQEMQEGQFVTSQNDDVKAQNIYLCNKKKLQPMETDTQNML
jgi:hypothetical protein